jgi:hypothetical protein
MSKPNLYYVNVWVQLKSSVVKLADRAGVNGVCSIFNSSDCQTLSFDDLSQHTFYILKLG